MFAIKKLIMLQSLRSEVHQMISNLEKEVVALEAKNVMGVRLLNLRKKHFFLLLHVDCI